MDKVKILVVDDEESIREGCNKILSRDGYFVKCAENGNKGLEILGKDAFDMSLIDLKMPGISGMQFLEAAQKINPDMINVIITGFASISSAVEAMKLGAYDYLTKPFTSEQLRQMIKRGVERLRLIEEARRTKIEQKNFILMVYHELKSPLSIIFGYLDNLSQREEITRRKEDAQIIDRTKIRTKELMQLVEDLLKISRMQEGKIKQNIEKLDLNDTLKKLVDFLKIEGEKREIKINLETTQLPFIFADREDMESLFSNLLSNAVKYNKQEGKVNIITGASGKYLHITISDTGIGISEENLPKIFDEFYRIRNEDTREVTGTGLGLSIVNKILEGYNGKIEVKSKVGEGSEFKVFLPKEIGGEENE